MTKQTLSKQQIDEIEAAINAASEIGAGIEAKTARILVAEIRRLHAKVREYGELAARRESELIARRAALEEIRHLHKDSPMGPCPVCIDADAVLAVLPAPADGPSRVAAEEQPAETQDGDRVKAIADAIGPVMLLGLQDAELFDEPGQERIRDWIKWISETVAALPAPEPVDRAAVLEEAAQIAVAENQSCPAVYQCQPCLTRERVAAVLLRAATDPSRLAEAPQPETQGGHVCKPGAATYFCPTSGETESGCHGGFGVCCDRPELHAPAVVAQPGKEADRG